MNPHANQSWDKRIKKRKKYVHKQELRFMNGGTYEDPLNLNSISSRNQSPAVSPSAMCRLPEFRVPVIWTDPNDPLNLMGKMGDKEHSEMVRGHLNRVIQSWSRKPRHSRHYRPKRRDREEGTDGHESAPEEGHEVEKTRRPRSFSVGSKSHEHSIVPPLSANSPRKRTRTSSEGTSCSDQSGDEASHPKRVRRQSGSKPEKKEPPQQAPLDQEEEKKPKELPERARFQYGNYSQYYGYRNFGLDTDPRLSLLSQHRQMQFALFHQKDVLDIGCNAGELTLAIAREFGPKSVLGLDIDRDLINRARNNLQKIIAATKPETPTAKFPKSAKMTFGPLIQHHIEDTKRGRFPNNVYFAQGNIVLDTEEELAQQKEEYDTILALSVTKWIHLNWGDEGLKRAFRRIYKMLRPGGYFIIEPQGMASYRRRKNLTARIKHNYENMELTPNFFKDYLRLTVGFRWYHNLGSSHNPAKGFDRPIYAFYKPRPDEEGNHGAPLGHP